MVPRIIDGKYEVVRSLGTGGMGVVFEARNVHNSRRVAVKVIAAALLAKGTEATTRFKREVKATSALDTPHVVKILDAGMDTAVGDPYIAMELLEGEDLKQLVDRLGPLQPEVALRIVAQACAGLKAAHDAGIIHRDIKSANLFLARDEAGEITVKILDFGIAKVVGDSRTSGQSTELTRTGSMLGSPRYMSPEQAKGQRDVGCRSDLWSLGVVLHELLTGTTPHAEIESVYALVVAIGTTPSPSVRRRAPWVLPEHAAILARALQIDPAHRFASAAEMLSTLRALLPGGSSLEASMLLPVTDETRRLSAALTSTSADGSLAISTTSRSVGVRGPSRRAVLFTSAALSLLLAGGLLARSGDGAVATVSALPAPAPAPAELVQSVRLAITPADATVEIDGRATPVEDGAVALSGAIGSIHLVRLTKSGQQATAEVILIERGALPPSVTLNVAPPGSATVATGASAPAPRARPSPPPRPRPAPPSTDPRPATDFE
jgi:serine/threonine-protein kinase